MHLSLSCWEQVTGEQQGGDLLFFEGIEQLRSKEGLPMVWSVMESVADVLKDVVELR
jgi:hypothetical protein